MSVNHYSTDHHHHHNTLLWQHCHTTETHPPETTATWHNNENDQKESLFEKTLTPSDVGKLNRLVIPKQHAERYFPLNAVSNNINNGADTSSPSSSSSSEKGMLLSFEDETGKCWRFRYSYWNSSQSYVLTKGWSRFVKDKQLDPGDVVFFQRRLGSHDSTRLFICCRRRRHGFSSSAATNSTVNTTSYSSVAPPPYLHSNYSNPPPHPEYYHYSAAVGTTTETHSMPSSSAVTGSSRTVRLFGVNLECQMDEDDGAATAAVDSHDGYSGQNMYYYYTTHPHNINSAFTGDTMK